MEEILNFIFIVAIISFFPICAWVAYGVFKNIFQNEQLDLVIRFNRWSKNRKDRAGVRASDARYQALIKLKSLYDDGVIDEVEYERDKQRLMG